MYNPSGSVTGRPRPSCGRGCTPNTCARACGRRSYDNDTAECSAVVRDWEHRFGARVVAVGFSTLHLSVASPPVEEHEALLVAAEHFAFCPDNIWQGHHRLALTSWTPAGRDEDRAPPVLALRKPHAPRTASRCT